ncbi:MAG: SDR family NAD(P)-dependent oxidoreductase [Gaiellaceae bacterium]
MSSDRLDGVALVTGGGRGIGASIARELTEAGMRVAVTARTREQAEAVAAEIDGLALVGDVSRADDVEEWVERTAKELGPIDLLAANAGIGSPEGATWEVPVEDWWGVLEVNVLGVHLSCRAVIPGMLERGSGRIVITGSGAAYLPGGGGQTAYPTSKAAVCRYAETLANELRDRIPVFVISPGLVRTDMTERFGDDMPWTPPELAPELVRVLASGRADSLAGRYLHAEHDDIEDLIRRADEVLESDLNAIRLQR